MSDASITGPIPDARYCEECGAEPTAPQQKACHECGAPLVPDPLVGTTLEERYEVVRRLGAGAMGAVYEVRHLRLGKRFAMKIIRKSLGREPEFAARFEQEALSTSRLEHPNCIAVTDYGQTLDGLLYLVMEFLEGHPLSSVLGEPLPVLRALRLTRQVLLGLQHAHQAGVVHRDVKPENAMVLDPDGTGATEQVKVLDFGIAKLPLGGGASDEGKSGSSRLTEAGVVFGTPDYMPPEQALGSADVDERADLYAVGVILWNMLTARQLFEADNSIELLQKKLAQDPPALGRVCPGVFSPQLERLVARALARNPRERIASAAEFIAGIDAVLEEPGRGLAAPVSGSVLDRLTPLWSRARDISAQTWVSARTVAGDWYGCGGTVAPTWGDRLRGLVRRRSGRIVLATGGGALALCALVLALVLGGGDAGPTVLPLPAQATAAKQPANRPPTRSPRPRNATERSLHMARLLLGKYACREAAIEMKNLLRREPGLAAAHYLLGAALICQREPQDGLAAYARAIDRAPKRYRTDARVLEDATNLLRARKRRTRIAALKFLEQHVGLAAKKQLLGAATHRDREVRHAAVAALVRLGAAEDIDWVTSLHLDLKQLSCAQVKSRRIVERLRGIDDPRVLAILKQARSARAGWFRHRRRFGCVMGELKAAIKAHQAKAPQSGD